MKHKRLMDTGARAPTTQEKQRIADEWGEEAKTLYLPRSGKWLRYIASFFTVIGVVGLSADTVDVAGNIVVFIIAAICWGVCFALIKHRKIGERRCAAIANGEYTVLSAVAVRIRYGPTVVGIDSVGFAEACLPDGRYFSKSVRLTARCARELLKQNVQRVPILIILIPNDPEFLAIIL